jgi:hypothetical protein
MLSGKEKGAGDVTNAAPDEAPAISWATRRLLGRERLLGQSRPGDMLRLMSPSLSASCVHCGQQVLDGANAIAKIEMRRLRDHLLGCPAALAACAPALPVFDRSADVLQHFRVERPQG